jgi:hypothetical protein
MQMEIVYYLYKMIPLRVELRSQESEPWVITTYTMGSMLRISQN